MPSLAEPAYMETQRCIWRCLAEFGPADNPAYPACVTRNCNDAPKKTTRSGRWIYGRHAVLGLSAYVTVGDEAFGLACAFAEDDPKRGIGGAVRMTPGLVLTATEELGAVSVWLGPFEVGGGQTFQLRPEGYVEHVGEACTLDIAGLQTHKALIFLQEKMLSLGSVDQEKPKMTVEREGKPVVIQAQDDLYNLAEATRIPLAGAADAIRKLAKACPVLRRQMSEECGDD